MVILLTNIEGWIEFQVLRILWFWSAFNINQGITHKADHLDFTFLIAHIDDHDGVRSSICRFLTHTLVRTKDKDINPISSILAVKGLN